MSENKAPESQDPAHQVYERVNFLMLKSSADYLVSLDPELLEDFVLKYSGVLIFLLNVLDADRSLRLLARLTNASVLSLLEEELRMLAIREVARLGEEPEKLITLTGYLDLLDRLAGQTEIPDGEKGTIREAIEILEEISASGGRSRFLYLEYFSSDQLQEIFRFNLEQNPPVNFGLLAFSSEQVRESILEMMARRKPEFLACVPSALYSIRNYKLFLEPGVFEYLPEAVQGIVKEFDALQKGKQDIITAIRMKLGLEEGDQVDPDQFPPEARNRALDLIYSRLRLETRDSRDFFLRQLYNEGYLRQQDLDLLRSALEGLIDL
ncbi:MAG TPA: hypothetical protein DEA96_15900 [Leptospiraceae bacterium]|nr:hypothetical protein [Spirochaetaceae bacterium]HBS06452.1 hypothetical protein [Leptospiraceae bacterium]